MNGMLRRGIIVAALFGIAGCNGGTMSQSPALSSQSASAVVHHGVPFALPVRHRVVMNTGGTYPTKNSLVFEGDQTETAVNIYLTKALASNPAPLATIHVAAGCPYGLARDKEGTVYVADNCGGNDVEEYPKGSTTESTSITDGVSNPLGVAIDKNQTLYVSNYPAAITEYAYGTTTPSKTVSGGGMSDPFGLCLDAGGNLYIADFGALAVFELPAGGSSVTNLGLQGLSEPIGLACDQKHGDLWVTDGGGDKIDVYHLGSTTPFETIAGNGFPYAISVQNRGNPRKDTVVESDIDTHYVYEYLKGQYTPYTSFNDGVEQPTGLLVTHL